MRRIPCLSVLLFVIALAAPGEAAQKKDAKKQDGGAPTAKDYQLLTQESTVVGKIVTAGGDRSLTLRFEYQTVDANARGGQRPPRAGRLYRNPLQQLQELQRQALKGQLKVITAHKDFALKATDDAPVRYLNLPTEFDDKGYPKKYTPAELKTLKGSNPNIPGYAADFEKLQPGDLVRVHFGKKAKEKAADDEAAPPVTMVVILQPGADPALAQPARKGKQK